MKPGKKYHFTLCHLSILMQTEKILFPDKAGYQSEVWRLSTFLIKSSESWNLLFICSFIYFISQPPTQLVKLWLRSSADKLTVTSILQITLVVSKSSGDGLPKIEGENLQSSGVAGGVSPSQRIPTRNYPLYPSLRAPSSICRHSHRRWIMCLA